MSAFLQGLKTFLGGSNLVKDVGDVLDNLITSKEEKAAGELELFKAKSLIEQAIKDYELKVKELAFEADKLYLEDRKSAREMQVSALQQSDKFAKRYLYVLSTIVVLAAIGFGVALMFVEIPEENKRTVELFADGFILAAVGSVINFFFGSSKGSADKSQQAMLDK